jgi:hypothetical protein
MEGDLNLITHIPVHPLTSTAMKFGILLDRPPKQRLPRNVQESEHTVDFKFPTPGPSNIKGGCNSMSSSLY